VLTEYCGRALVVEHNGDLYSCDHFVTPAHRLGNVMTRPLGQLVDCRAQRSFALAKSHQLPSTCGSCAHVQRCWGACPKDRLGGVASGEPPPNYLCAGYRRFFDHTSRAFAAMAAALGRGQSAAAGLRDWRGQQAHGATKGVGPEPSSASRKKRRPKKRARQRKQSGR
jgi:uncharacterized protein